MKYCHYRIWKSCLSVLALLLFSSACTSAQNIDSLRTLLHAHKAEDTTKVKLYAELAGAYRFTGPDSILYYADKGLALAEQLHYDVGKAKCLTKKTLAYLINGNSEAGLRYGMEAITILGKTSDSTGMGMALYYVAAVYYNQSKFEQAIKYYKRTAAALDKTGHYDLAGDALDNIGVCYSTTGDFSESLKYYLEGLKVREKDNDKKGVATSLGNIGRVYASLGDRKKALEYINRSLASQGGSSPDILMINYENAGNVYLTIKDTAKALSAFETAIQMADSAKQPGEINRILVNTAEVLIQMKNYEKAYQLYQRCLANTDIPNMPAVDAMIHRGLGRVYVYRKNYREGAKELELAIKMFRENEMKDHSTETLKDLAYAYGGMHDYTRAFNTLVLFHASRDSIQDETTDKKVQDLQYEYDLQKKQTEIELLAKDKAIAQATADKQRLVTTGLISGIALLFVIIVLMYRSGQRNKATSTLIAQQAASLRELNSYKDKIFSVISHDMRGPITALDASLNLLDENIISSREFGELKPELHKQLASVIVLLDNLLKWSMSHMKGGGTLKTEKLNIHKMVSQNIALMQNTITEKNITITNKVKTDTTATGDAGNIDIIIRNLISNAVKFTRHGGEVHISATTNDSKLALSFSDNGIGMDDAQIKKLFTISPGNSTAGTMGELGIGLGLLMSYEFARANNGDITVTSTPGKGSTFTLILPG